MLILGIDTTTLVGSVGLISESGVLGEFTLNIKRTHSERLLPALNSLLEEGGVTFSQLDLISVSLGPGSFTGVRIGVTTANSLSQASQKPMVGVYSLDVLAHNLAHVQGLVCPILDARKQEVYTALYRGEGKGLLTKVSDYAALSLDKLIENLESQEGNIYFVGDGVKVYAHFLKDALGSRYIDVPAALQIPRGVVVAQLGGEKWLEGNNSSYPLTPFYLRKSEAELAWEKKQSE